MTTSRRCVALKINEAELTGVNHEIAVLKRLTSSEHTHYGKRYIMPLIDSFRIEGPNGIHEVVVTELFASSERLSHDSVLLYEELKRICYQVTEGIAFLQEHGITHNGK